MLSGCCDKNVPRGAPSRLLLKLFALVQGCISMASTEMADRRLLPENRVMADPIL